MKRTVKRPTVKQVAEEKAAILGFLGDGEKHTFREIQAATGLAPEVLERRLLAMRDQLEYLGRTGIGAGTNSYYRAIPQPGIIPDKMREYPSSYLSWGGWTA
jgi:hypothetical protein